MAKVCICSKLASHHKFASTYRHERLTTHTFLCYRRCLFAVVVGAVAEEGDLAVAAAVAGDVALENLKGPPRASWRSVLWDGVDLSPFIVL